MTRHEYPILRDEGAERAVIGAALVSQTLFWDIAGRLEPGHITTPRLARVWQAMLTLGRDGKSVSVEMVPQAIRGDERADMPLRTFLAILASEAPDGSTAKDLAEVVIHLAGKRAVLDALDRARAEVLGAEFGTSIETVQEVAMGMIGSATGTGFDRHMRSLGEWGAEVAEQIARTFDKGEEGTVGFSSGLRAVDEAWGRLMPKRLYVLAGLSGGGKSALSRQIAEAMARQSAATGAGQGYIASLEMSGEEHAIRTLSDQLGIPASRIEEGSLNWQEVQSLRERARDLAGLPIMIDTRPRMKIADIRNRALRLKHQRGLAFAFIDHLLLIRPSRDKDGLMDRVMESVVEAKDIARELEIPVILLAQIDEKKVNERSSGRPIASDLFGGQAIKQNADAVGFIHRPEVVEKNREPPKNQPDKHSEWLKRMIDLKGKASFFNDKRRAGEGQVSRNLLFDGPTMTFRDV